MFSLEGDLTGGKFLNWKGDRYYRRGGDDCIRFSGKKLGGLPTALTLLVVSKLDYLLGPVISCKGNGNCSREFVGLGSAA